MLEKVEYIQNIFNLTKDNPYIVKDIEEELQKIDSFDDLRKWLKNNLNHHNIQYLDPFQKFIFLVRRYSKQKLELNNKKSIKNSKTFTKKFSKKLEMLKKFVEKYEELGKEIVIEDIKRNSDDKPFFNNYEKTQIVKLGGLAACMNLLKYKSDMNLFEEIIVMNAYEMMLTNIIKYKSKEKTDNRIKSVISEIAEDK